jgi:hypothetical protein
MSFPFDLHSAALFDSHMPCRSHAVPLPCHEYVVLKAISQGHRRGTAWQRHGMCKLASAVQRRHVGDLPAFGTVGEWQGRGRAAAGERHGMCEVSLNTAEERHGNCMVCVNRLLDRAPGKQARDGATASHSGAIQEANYCLVSATLETCLRRPLHCEI